MTALVSSARIVATWLVAGLTTSAALAQAPLEPPASAPEPSLTQQLLDPDQTPLARPAGPRSLLPPAESGAEFPADFFGPTSPEVLFPSGDAAVLPPTQPAEGFAARPGEEGTGIEVARLSGLADDGVGLIGPIEGGFSPQLWAGSRRLAIEDGLASLTPPPPSAALGDLFRRLLVSRGDLPQGASAGQSILGLRMAALYDAGFAADVDALAGLVPAGDMTAQIAAPAARAALALGFSDKACGYLTRLPTEGGADDPYAAFALELGALCQARAGLQVAALLSVDLVREQRGSDTAFVALATRAAGGPALDVPSDEIFSSLHYALVAEAGAPLPDNILDRAEPALLPLLADDTSLDWATRIAFAEAAGERALMSARTLGEFYRRAIIEDGAVDNPRLEAFAASLDTPSPAQRLEAIAEAFAQTPQTRWGGLLPAFAGSLRAIPPAMVHADQAAFMVEALALLGDALRADAWIGIAATAAPAQISRLEALVRIATPRQSSFVVPWNPELALTAVQVRLQNDDPGAKWLTAFEMQALASLGLPMPQIIWAQFDDADMLGVRLGDAQLRALRVAAESRRSGEAALATLTSLALLESDGGLGQAGPWVLTPGSLAAIMTALARSGLEEDARQIAVEALIVRAHAEG